MSISNKMPLKTADVLKKGKYGFYNNIAHPINNVFAAGAPTAADEGFEIKKPAAAATATAKEVKDTTFAPLKAALLDFLDWPDMGDAGGSTADTFKKAANFATLMAKKLAALSAAILQVFTTTSHPNFLDKIVDYIADLLEQLDPDNRENRPADRATIEFVAYFVCITPLVYFMTQNWFYHFLFEYAKQTEGGGAGLGRLTKFVGAVVNNFGPLAGLKRAWNLFFPQGDDRKRSGGDQKQDVQYPLNNLPAAFAAWKMNHGTLAFFLHLALYPAVFIDHWLTWICRTSDALVGTAFSAVLLFIAVYYVFHYWTTFYGSKALDVIEYIAIIVGWLTWVGEYAIDHIGLFMTSPLFGAIVVFIVACINLMIGIQLKPYAHIVVLFYFFIMSFLTIGLSEGFGQIWTTVKVMYDFYSGVYGDGGDWKQMLQSAIWKNFGFLGTAFVLLVFLLSSVGSGTSSHMIFAYIIVLVGFGLLVLAIATNMWGGWWDRWMDGETAEKAMGGPPARRRQSAPATPDVGVGDIMANPLEALNRAREMATNPAAAFQEAAKLAQNPGAAVAKAGELLGGPAAAAAEGFAAAAKDKAGELLGGPAAAAAEVAKGKAGEFLGGPAAAAKDKAGELLGGPAATAEGFAAAAKDKAGEFLRGPAAAAALANPAANLVPGLSGLLGKGGAPVFDPSRKFRPLHST